MTLLVLSLDSMGDYGVSGNRNESFANMAKL